MEFGEVAFGNLNIVAMAIKDGHSADSVLSVKQKAIQKYYSPYVYF